MLDRAPDTVFRSSVGCRASTQRRSVWSGAGTRPAIRRADGGSKSARSVVGPAPPLLRSAEPYLRAPAEPVEERRRALDAHHGGRRAARAEAFAAGQCY